MTTQIVVTEFMDAEALGQFGADVSVNYAPELVDDRAAMLAAIRGVSAVIVRNRTQVDATFLEAAPQLKVVGRLGVGLDNIDLGACAERGIKVCPATGANTRSVAEYVIGAAMLLTRGAFQSSEEMLAGQWPRATLGSGHEVTGRHLGLVGLGEIAREVAQLAQALGLHVSACDPHVATDDPVWDKITRCSLKGLLETSDVLSLHIPLTPDTNGMIDADAIERMKSGAILINTARGGIVEEDAVVAALRSGHLGGAALDVFAQEPLSIAHAEKFAGAPNLVLTPHIAGVTDQANTRVSHVTVQNVIRALALD
jgi:(S)-sulfolactate dehydrogenase